MKEPSRLREERGSALEHALLSAGVSPVGSSETRAKTLAALGLAGSATLLVGAAGATSLSSLAKVGWAKLVLGASLVGAVTAVPVGYYLVRHHAQVPVAVAPAARATVAVAAPLAPPAPAVEPAIAPVPEARPTHAAHTPARPSAAPRSTLTHELAALDAARSTLAGGDARSALALLDIYEDSFPHGRLELEAEVLRIDALAKSGRPEAARRRADTFLRQHPQSVLASRVRADARHGD
jgi:hypothetical protein